MIWRCDLEPQADYYLNELLDVTRQVLSSGRYMLASRVKQFEEEFAAYIGVPYCISMASGTDALIHALWVIGILPEDEIITTPFTAIPTISAIVAAGGKPVFVDIDPETYLIDIEQIPSVITDKTRAIVPVHLFAQMVDIERLQNLLPRHIPIIEDAAQAHGCRLRGKMAGTIGDLAAFSFYPTKNLGGYGDGGAVVTNNPEYDHKLRLRRNYGKETPDHIVLDGINSRLDELQAAWLSLKLPDLEAMNKKRRELAALYKDELEGLPVTAPLISKGALPNYHVYVVKVLEHRNELKNFLMEQGIQTDIFYPYPHHLHPAYKHLGYSLGDFPNAEQAGSQVLALPMYPELSKEVAKKITLVIRRFFDEKNISIG